MPKHNLPPEPHLLVLGTHNRNKARELAEMLGGLPVKLCSLADLPDAGEIDEDGASLADNARLKAATHARRLRRWVLGDDTGLEVDALGGAPGVRSARFAGPGADAAANRAKLLAAMADIPASQRGARFVCHLALADTDGAIRAEAYGQCRGRILFEPVGDRGFGYDVLFEVIEYGLTFAQLGPAAMSCLSHRGRAIERIRPKIARLMV